MPESFNEAPNVTKRLGGANKRFFQLRLENKDFIAHPPRPNVCLEQPLLFNDDLVTQCRHEFASYCLYRHLSGAKFVPRCALYTFDLAYDPIGDLLQNGGRFKWAFLLLENFEHVKQTRFQDIKKCSENLLGADLLMGNWGCVDGGDLQALADNFVYATGVLDNNVIRIAVDRSLGNTYPEDVRKSDKVPIEFGDTTADLRTNLLQRYKFLYGHLDDKAVSQNIMKLRLDQLQKTDLIDRCAKNVEWPVFLNGSIRNRSILDILSCRREHLLETLPYHYLPTETDPESRPAARDGHAAVSFPGNRTMYIFGGNSKDGTLDDVWKLDVPAASWVKMKSMPDGPRHSFSAHPWTSHGLQYVVIFGGGNTRGLRMKNTLLLFDVQHNKWRKLNLPSGCHITGRCRHASTWHVDETGSRATMHVIGGHDERSSRKDVYEIVLKHEHKDSFPKVISCQPLADLPTNVHRAFAFTFPNDNRILSIGGMGRGSSLRTLQVIRGDAQEVLAHGALDAGLPNNLSGFGAVVDATDERVVVLGGGRIQKGFQGKSLGRSMGIAPAHEQPFRMLYLARSLDSEGREEWEWKTDKAHELLDPEFRLPVRTSWSACLLDHKIILFGGRHGESFSNDTIVVPLRANYVKALGEINVYSKAIQVALDEINRIWGPTASIDAKTQIANDLRLK